MANPTVTAVAPSVSTASAGGTISPSLTGLTVGNILVMLVTMNSGTVAVPTPSGWTAVTGASDLQNPSGTSSDRSSAAFTKAVSATTDGGTITLTGKYQVILFEVQNTSGVRASSASSGFVSTAGANPTVNTGAGVTTNDLVISYVACMTAALTYAPGTGYTGVPSSAPATTNVSTRAQVKTATGGGAQAAAYTNATTSLWSEIVFALAPPAVPVAPATPSATQSGANLAATWSDNGTGGSAITNHTIYAYAASSGGSPVQTIVTGNAATGGTVTGLTPGSTFYLEVTATNAIGESAHSTRSAGTFLSGLTFVQANFAFAASSAATVTAGNLLVVAAVGLTADTLAVSDTTGNTWAAVGSSIVGANRQMAVWTATPLVGGSTTITVSGESVSAHILWGEYAPTVAGNTLAVDQHTSGASTTSPLTLTTLTTGTADEIDVFFVYDYLIASRFLATGYTQRQAIGFEAPSTLVFEEKAVQAIGTQTASDTSTLNTGGELDGILFTLQSVPPATARGRLISQAVNRSNTY